MKILWISNVVFPEACEKLCIASPVVGGWMQSGANALLDINTVIELGVASLYMGSQFRIINGQKMRYYLIPQGKGDSRQNAKRRSVYEHIIRDFNPDLVHIHGSEYPHSLDAAIVCKAIPFVVSIQGLVSRCSDYYYAGIPARFILHNTTLRDILRFDTLFAQRHRMKKRGKYEQKLLCITQNVIGRTSWDKSCIWTVNPNAYYHFCNETLRTAFYETKWSFETCVKHSIFISQAHYPIKGAHKLFNALPKILESYPDTKVFVAGNNFINLPWYRKNGYSRYLQQIIRKYSLEDKIIFLGLLDEQEMANQYAHAHVFVSPSSIENSPNSVGEAQLVGTPVIGSYVGGTMDMITDGETGFLYRFEETSLLAMRICQLFDSPELCQRISENERRVAKERHDGPTNARQLLSIYQSILAK